MRAPAAESGRSTSTGSPGTRGTGASAAGSRRVRLRTARAMSADRPSGATASRRTATCATGWSAESQSRACGIPATRSGRSSGGDVKSRERASSARWPPVLRIAPPPPLYLEGDGAAGLGSLTGEPAASGDAATSTWAGPPDVGLCAPFWCGYGYPPQGVPGDQRADDARSLLCTSPPLERPILVAGIPHARLWLSADQPVAQVAVRLEAVAPDGRSALIARAVRNLTRLDPAAEAPVPLVPGEPVEVDLPLSAAGARIPAGHRLRVAVAGAAFPIAWPTPTPVCLTLHHDVARPSALRLPTAAGWSSCLLYTSDAADDLLCV